MTAPQRIVVVGTGTGVGKTWLGCELLRTLGSQGCRAIGLKPIESGVDGSAATDAALLGERGLANPESASGPPAYRFVEPISPHLAARRAGQAIDLDAALRYVQYHESASGHPPEVSVVETAGGLFSPLGPGLTNFDLALALEPARWLLVAPDALGVLHDLTATLEAARARGRLPDAVALCQARPLDASSGTNAEEARRLGITERPFVFPADGDVGLRDLAALLLA